jgi:hypothetical protein
MTKQQLENAARAMGLELSDWSSSEDGFIRYHFVTRHIWNPLSATTQGKADLQDLMLALKICFTWVDAETYESVIASSKLLGKFVEVRIINGDKHAALAEAVVSVASQIWESKQ